MANALNMVRDNIVVEVSLAAAFVVALAVVLLSTRSIVRWASVVVAIGLAFASNGLVMRSYNPTVPASEFYPHTPAVLAVTKQISNGETLFTGQSFPFASTNLWFGLHDIGSYDAIGFKWHDALYEKAFAVRSPSVERMPACRNVLRLFGKSAKVSGFVLPVVVGMPELMREGIEKSFALMRDKKLKLVIGKSFPLAQAAEAHRFLQSRQSVGKLVLLA